MARIAGVDLPRSKRIEVALTYIYGIGHTTAKKIIQISKVNPDIRVNKLTDEDVTKLRKVIENDYNVEGTLRGEIQMNIKRLVDIGSYRGLRHRRGLPVRGQNTKNNSRTRKGPKRSIGGLKRKPMAKK